MLEFRHVWNTEIDPRPGGDAFASANPVRIDLSGCMNAIISGYEQRIPRRPLACWRYREETLNKKHSKSLQLPTASCHFYALIKFSSIHRELRYMVKFTKLTGSRQLPFEDFVARLTGSLNLWCSAVALHDSMQGGTAGIGGVGCMTLVPSKHIEPLTIWFVRRPSSI